jgi:CRP/FNR family cyclic AMP-dependent transcriptional regulator
MPVSDLFDRLLLLKHSQIFSMVTTEDLRHVAGSLEQVQFFRGDRIFEINDQGDHLYLLVSGKVGISIDPNPGSKNYIATFGPGDCFGEMNLLDDLPRSATAHVLEDAVVLTLEKSRLRGLILSYPEISIGMLRAMSMRLREANRRAPAAPAETAGKQENKRASNK